MPAFTQFIGGGGPIIPGPLFPFVFITIACGAISGFHALIGSGTTPKMIDKESDIRPIGYGAMLIEGVVGIMALIAATALHPGDYFAINMSPAAYAAAVVRRRAAAARQPGDASRRRSARTVEGPHGRRGVAGRGHGEDLQRPARHAGPDGLLVPLRDHVRGALHPDDHRLRHARRAVPAAGGRSGGVCAVRAHRLAARRRSSRPALIVGAWGYFIYTGQIDTIWPMFGVANQLLGCVALAVATTVLITQGKARYTWVTLAPLFFLAINTFYGGFLNIRDNYWPKAIATCPR